MRYGPLNPPKVIIVVEYSKGSDRVTKEFTNPFKAKAFFVEQHIAGNTPRLKARHA